MTLKVVTGRYGCVFPERSDMTKPMSELSIHQILKRLGCQGQATGHGFRYTVRTILHKQGG